MKMVLISCNADEFYSIGYDAGNRARRVRLRLIHGTNQSYESYNGRLKYCTHCRAFFLVLSRKAGELNIFCPFCHRPLRNRARKKAFKWEKAINPEALLGARA